MVGQQIILPFSLNQMFNSGGMNTQNETGVGFSPYLRCFSKFYMPGTLNNRLTVDKIMGLRVPYGFNALKDYGLGTMFS